MGDIILQTIDHAGRNIWSVYHLTDVYKVSTGNDSNVKSVKVELEQNTKQKFSEGPDSKLVILLNADSLTKSNNLEVKMCWRFERNQIEQAVWYRKCDQLYYFLERNCLENKGV